MSIEDYLRAELDPHTSYPPSRLRAMLDALRARLVADPDQSRLIALYAGKSASVARFTAEIDEVLAEWTKLDNLELQQQTQRQRIAKRLPAIVEFVAVLQMQLRPGPLATRRKLNSAKRILSTAKLQETRRLRKTLGKRQRKKPGL